MSLCCAKDWILSRTISLENKPHVSSGSEGWSSVSMDETGYQRHKCSLYRLWTKSYVFNSIPSPFIVPNNSFSQTLVGFYEGNQLSSLWHPPILSRHSGFKFLYSPKLAASYCWFSIFQNCKIAGLQPFPLFVLLNLVGESIDKCLDLPVTFKWKCIANTFSTSIAFGPDYLL